MLKWVRERLYTGYTGLFGTKRTGHTFMCEDSMIHFDRFSTGHYPPFDCLSLTLAQAIKLRDWLNEAIVSYQCGRNLKEGG